jgi:hypothetical protein
MIFLFFAPACGSLLPSGVAGAFLRNSLLQTAVIGQVD